jgi:hypothetical protein
MQTWNRWLPVVTLALLPLSAAAQDTSALDQVVDHIVAQEKLEMQSLRQYSPLVETYIQNLKPDRQVGTAPAGDKYFLGKARLANGVELEPLAGEERRDGLYGIKHKLGGLFSGSMEFLPVGFLQMIYVDTNGFDQQTYKFEYVRREFLGEVRCLVFDVTPKATPNKGRFAGRIWVEDQDFHIVRFNGAYSGSTKTDYYFHFDSWRVYTGSNQWLPAFIYTEEKEGKLAFKGQTRLWGYNLGRSQQEQELSKVLVEAAMPVKDQADAAHDFSPLQAQRNWDQQAEDNVIDRMSQLGLLAPVGEVDKVLETVANNLEVTNNLNIQPEVRCRVLMTSTIESFTLDHTIVLSRGLIDVLPDEASLATVMAHELGHVVLKHKMDTQYAFFDRMLFNDKDAFQHFGFARTPDEEKAATQKGAELLKNSPYKDQLATPELFIQALHNRAKEVPNLISPHLGNGVETNWAVSSGPAPAQQGPGLTVTTTGDTASPAPTVLAALPLGGRIKMNPWTDELTMLKSKPVGTIAEREKMPFEVTPFVLYLTREASASAPASAETGAVSAQSKPDTNEAVNPSNVIQ